MSASTLFIDDCGVFTPIEVLTKKLHSSLQPAKLGRFAVMNLGHIGIATRRDSVQITLRPAVVEDAALARLYYWLRDNPPQRLAIIWFDDEWHQEIIGWGCAGWRRLTELIRPPCAEALRFSRKSVAPNDLSRSHPVNALLKQWKEFATGGDFQNALLETQFDGRFLTVQCGSDGQYRIQEIGRTMMSRAPAWRRLSYGMRFDDFPDYAYGRWLTPAYHEVAMTREPLVEKVNAVVEWPRRRRLRHAYWRIIVPIKVRRRALVLLGATLDR